jgi:hypothetical protein
MRISDKGHLNIWGCFFRLYCEEVFTTENTKSTKERRFNRKEAKGRKEFAFQNLWGRPPAAALSKTQIHRVAHDI